MINPAQYLFTPADVHDRLAAHTHLGTSAHWFQKLQTFGSFSKTILTLSILKIFYQEIARLINLILFNI